MGIPLAQTPKHIPVECCDLHNGRRMKTRIKFNKIILPPLTKRSQPWQKVQIQNILSFDFLYMRKMNLNLEKPSKTNVS